MIKFKNFPGPVKEKFVSLLIVGILFWLGGIVVTVVFNDTVMFVLSVLICMFSLIKATGLYLAVSKGEYETIKGTCVSVSPILIRKQKKVTIKDNDGNERLMILGRYSRIDIGKEYNFYFKGTRRISLGQEYFDSVLAADCFLGYEESNKE